MEKLRESKSWKVVKGLGGALVAIVTLWSGGIAIAEKNAAQLVGFAAWTADNSWWVFPLSMMAGGLIIGWNAKRYLMNRENVTAERIAELEAANRNMSDRLAAINDREAKQFMEQLPFVKVMALEAYDRNGIVDPQEFLFDHVIDDDILGFVDDLFIQEGMVPKGIRWVLKPEVKQMLDRRPDLLDQAREARDAGNVGEWECYTVLDDCVARDEKKYLESRGLEFMTWESPTQ